MGYDNGLAIKRLCKRSLEPIARIHVPSERLLGGKGLAQIGRKDYPEVVHPLSGVSHSKAAVPEYFEIRPKRAAEEAHAIDRDSGIQQQVDAKLRSQVLCPQHLVLDRETLAIGVPLMISGNINHRSASRPLSKPANACAKRIVYIAGCDEHVVFWLGIGQIPVALLNM